MKQRQLVLKAIASENELNFTELKTNTKSTYAKRCEAVPAGMCSIVSNTRSSI